MPSNLQEKKCPPRTAPENGELIGYADGACKGNPGPAGVGSILISPTEYRELSEFLGHGTNNIAELTALLRIAQEAKALSMPLHVFTDSTYAIGVLVRGWKVKANQALVAELKTAMEALPAVTFTHVRGHAGIELNERADALARHAVDASQSLGWSTEGQKLPVL